VCPTLALGDETPQPRTNCQVPCARPNCMGVRWRTLPYGSMPGPLASGSEPQAKMILIDRAEGRAGLRSTFAPVGRQRVLGNAERLIATSCPKPVPAPV